MGGYSTNCPGAIEIRNAKEAIVTYQNGKTVPKFVTPFEGSWKDRDRGHLWFEAFDITFPKYYPELVERYKKGWRDGQGNYYKNIHHVPAKKISVTCKDGTRHHVECKDTPHIKHNMNGYTTFCLNKAVPASTPAYLGIPSENASHYEDLKKDWSGLGSTWANKTNTFNSEYFLGEKRDPNEWNDYKWNQTEPTLATYAVCTEKDVSKCPSKNKHRQVIQKMTDTHAKFDYITKCPHPVHIMRTDFDKEAPFVSYLNENDNGYWEIDMAMQCGETEVHIGPSKYITRKEIPAGAWVTRCMAEPLKGCPQHLGVPEKYKNVYPNKYWANFGDANFGAWRRKDEKFGVHYARRYGQTFLVCTEKDVTDCPTLQQHRTSVQAHLDTNHQAVKTCEFPVHIRNTDNEYWKWELFIPHRDQHNPDYLQQLREDENPLDHTDHTGWNDRTIVFVPGENLIQQENGYITKCLLEKPENYVSHIGYDWGTKYGNIDTNWANAYTNKYDIFQSSYQICYEPNVEDCPSIEDQRYDRKALELKASGYKCDGEETYLCCDGDEFEDLTCDPCWQCCEWKDAVEFSEGKIKVKPCPAHCNCDGNSPNV